MEVAYNLGHTPPTDVSFAVKANVTLHNIRYAQASATHVHHVFAGDVSLLLLAEGGG